MKSAAKTSEQECQTMRTDIAYLTSHLQDLMQANAGQSDWGEAGSLEHVRHLLKRAVSFYGGLEDGEIEETLAELRD